MDQKARTRHKHVGIDQGRVDEIGYPRDGWRYVVCSCGAWRLVPPRGTPGPPTRWKRNRIALCTS